VLERAAAYQVGVELIGYFRVILAQGAFAGETVKSFLYIFDYLFHFNLRMNNI